MNADEDALLAGLLEDAAQTMQRLSGGMAVCIFTRAGKPVPGVKYAEGRWAALRAAHRKALTTTSLTEALAELSATWRSSLQRSEERAAGPDWLAYYTGGLDALTELVARRR